MEEHIGLGDILESSLEANHKVMGPFLWGELTFRDTIQRFSFCNWRRARLDGMVKKWGRKSFYISCNYSRTISFLMKILLVKLKYLYTQYA